MSQSAAVTTGEPDEIVDDARARVTEDQKQSFLRVASHQLRTPLNSIIGFSEVLAGEVCGPLGAPQYKGYAQHVLASGRQLLRLVNQILEILRLQAGVAGMEPLSEPLDAAVGDSLDALGQDMSRRSMNVVVDGEGELPTVRCDPRGLRTVLTNLLHNAITYCPEAGEVRLRAACADGRVVIDIENDGPQIAAEDVPRLLKPFEQGAAALTGAGEGAGLGLPIVSLYCAAMHGSLRLTPREGGGLTARLTLPAG
ncbi:MAG: sensor histidine kinase [Caulobacteraceae bacterium]